MSVPGTLQLKWLSTYKVMVPGEIAPALHLATEENLKEMLLTGEHLDFEDFQNACTTLHVDKVNASRAYSSTVQYLARDIYALDSWRVLSDTLDTYGNKDNRAAIRRRLLLGTQAVADIVQSHLEGTFPDSDLYTKRMLRVVRTTVMDEFDIDFVRTDRQTDSVITRKLTTP